MRKTQSSGKTFRMVRLSSCADDRSRPKGFSTTSRPSRLQAVAWSAWTTVSKSDGGMAM